jgi:hypothetical protein
MSDAVRVRVRLSCAALCLTACGAATTAPARSPSAARTAAATATPSPEIPALSTRGVVATVRVGGPWFAVGGGWLWAAVDTHGPVAAGGTPHLVRVDTATNRIDTTTLDFTQNITDVALAGGVVRVLLPNQLVLADAASMHVTARVDLPGTDTRLAVGAGADWVADSGDGTLLRVDQRTHAITATIRITSAANAATQDNGGMGGEPSEIAVSGGVVWATMDAEQSIARVDPAANTVAATYPLPFGGVNTLYADGSGGLWADFFDDGRFVHVDAAGHVQVLPIQAAQPVGFLVRGGDLWYISHRVGELWRVDIASGRVLERIATGAPGGDVHADGNTIWAWGNGDVIRIDAGLG